MPPIYSIRYDEDEGFIAIDRKGKEMLYWSWTEWEDDSDTLFVILKAVEMALTNPTAMDAKLREMKKIT